VESSTRGLELAIATRRCGRHFDTLPKHGFAPTGARPANPITMRLLDLSQPLFDAAPNCPVHPPVSFRRTADHPADGWRMEEIAMATHTGSHLDAPLHKIAGGKSISDLPLDTFVGPARIVDLRGIAADAPITAAMLAPKLKGVARRDIVLLATGWGDKRVKNEEWRRFSIRTARAGSSSTAFAAWASTTTRSAAAGRSTRRRTRFSSATACGWSRT
jgi:hypothetical protein